MNLRFLIPILAISAFAQEKSSSSQEKDSFVQENQCGIIDLPTVWTKENSPYRITGDIQIASSARLTIEAGVDVLIVPGEACGETTQLDWSDSTYISIKASGPLIIKGTAEEPVRIMPENHVPGKIQWDGIRFSRKDRPHVQIEYMYIMGANRAINASFSRFNLANSLFINNSTGIWLENEADISVYNCVFTENLSAGIYIANSRPTIAANIFYKNANFGIWSDSRPSPRVQNNIFYANADVDCRYCPVGVLRSNDKFGNIYADPVFIGSPKEKVMAKADLKVPTSADKVKDPALQMVYEKSIPGGRPKQEAPAKLLPFTPSVYSPALHAAPKTDFFRNVDGGYGDIGLYGGMSGRFNKPISL
ncbi:MAG: right-handed parallel beta-helix repeat-containing protein [Fibromonadales bacterium]|nr:right-handed parallel beta-helix repeat-containing protein [Fibromonadales bacterium]